MTDINPTAIAEERYPDTQHIVQDFDGSTRIIAGHHMQQRGAYAACIVERELPLRERIAELEGRLRSLTEAAQGAADALDAYKAYSESSTMNIEHEESILLTGDRALSTLSKEGITPGGG
jgi:hypothetical protein